MTTFEYLPLAPHSRLLRLADVAAVSEALRAGGLAVLPTETGYMIAAAATLTAAAHRAFSVKERSLAHPMHVACASLAMAAEFSALTPAARRLLGEFTPGPLTVVVGKNDRLPDEYVTAAGTVGIRVPDHPATLQVIAALGVPVTATSLNRSGERSTLADRAALEALNWQGLDVVYVVPDDDAIRYSLPSTLVRLTGDAPEILRAGPVTEEQVLAAYVPAG